MKRSKAKKVFIPVETFIQGLSDLLLEYNLHRAGNPTQDADDLQANAPWTRGEILSLAYVGVGCILSGFLN